MEGDHGYICYGCGITSRPVRQRMLEHRLGYLRGAYTIFNMAAMKQGIRQEIWHGMWAGHNTPERQSEFHSRKPDLQRYAIEQMESMRIFVSQVAEKRIQERIEAATVQSFYDCPEPYCNLPDKGTLMLPRRADEPGLIFINNTDHRFVNLAHRVYS